jgi:GTP-binding protein
LTPPTHQRDRAIASSMSVLQQAQFFTTVDRLHQLPLLGLPELAFAGRSNAGKSTAINPIANQKRLAFASKTPGRTQHINFFAVGTHPDDPEMAAAFLVDLPGYGYAQVARDSRAHWEQTLGTYIRKRNELVGLVLIMDARRPFTDLDETMVAWFAETAKPIHVLLTKADKLNRNDRTNALRSTRTRLAELSPFHTAQLFSALDKTGVEEADQRILDLLGLQDAVPLTADGLRAMQVERTKKTPAQGE